MSTVVIKLGGELLAPEKRAEAEAIAQDVAALASAGHRVVMVHGGGPQVTALQKRLGQEPVVIGGRRVTDDAALEVIEMVIGGKLNLELCARLVGAGVRPIGLSGASSQVIAAKKRPPKVVTGGGPDPIDFGHVGDVTRVDAPLLEALASRGHVPVLACIGCDETGRLLNINADIVANQVAAALRADRLVLVTGTPGVLGSVEDPSSRIPTLTRAEAKSMIASGAVGGGMIPKLEESFPALEKGVGGVVIIGRLAPGDLFRAITTPGAAGTTLLP